MVFGMGVDLAVAIFVIATLAHYVGVVKKAEKAFTWIVAGAVSFLLAGVFEAAPLIADWVTVGGVNYGFALFGAIGFILVLVGALWTIYQLLTE